MKSLIRLVFGLPFWAYIGIALVLVYLAELGIQNEAAADDAPGGRDLYGVALVFAVIGMVRLLMGRREEAESQAAQMRRVEEAARLAQELPPPAAAEDVAAETSPPAYPDDSPIGRLRTRRGGGEDGGGDGGGDGRGGDSTG